MSWMPPAGPKSDVLKPGLLTEYDRYQLCQFRYVSPEPRSDLSCYGKSRWNHSYVRLISIPSWAAWMWVEGHTAVSNQDQVKLVKAIPCVETLHQKGIKGRSFALWCAKQLHTTPRCVFMSVTAFRRPILSFKQNPCVKWPPAVRQSQGCKQNIS